MDTRNSYFETASDAPQQISLACERSGIGSKARALTAAYPHLPRDIPPKHVVGEHVLRLVMVDLFQYGGDRKAV